MGIRDEYGESEGERRIREYWESLTPEQQRRELRKERWSYGTGIVVGSLIIISALIFGWH